MDYDPPQEKFIIMYFVSTEIEFAFYFPDTLLSISVVSGKVCPRLAAHFGRSRDGSRKVLHGHKKDRRFLGAVITRTHRVWEIPLKYDKTGK